MRKENSYLIILLMKNSIFFFGKPYFKVVNMPTKNYEKKFKNIASISLMVIIHEDEKNTRRGLNFIDFF